MSFYFTAQMLVSVGIKSRLQLSFEIYRDFRGSGSNKDACPLPKSRLKFLSLTEEKGDRNPWQI